MSPRPLLAPALDLSELCKPFVEATGDKFELSENERWYVVFTQPLRETLARTQLAQQGFRSFLPLHLKTVRHARKIRTINAPIFPRYLFAILDLDRHRWRSVNGTCGVTSLVMARERPLAVPFGIVETLINSTDKSGLVSFVETLKRGDPVRLKAGPFAEALGVLARLDGARRVEILMKILNGEVRLNVPREWVESSIV